MLHVLLYSFLRSFLQAELLQSPEIFGVHPNKLAHPEDESDVPQKNRYDSTTALDFDLLLSLILAPGLAPCLVSICTMVHQLAVRCAADRG